MKRTKMVCAKCGSDAVEETAWIGVNDGKVNAGDGPLSDAYRNDCPGECDLDEIDLTPEEQAAELRTWKRRARSAAEAMTVAAIAVLGVEVASHLVANVLASLFAEAEGPPEPDPLPGEAPAPSLLERLRSRVEADRRHRAEHPSYRYEYPEAAPVERLLVELDVLWSRAHAGENVTPDSLDLLREWADVRQGKRALRTLRSEGFWHVFVESPEGRVLARGEHPMLAVAAEIARSRIETPGTSALRVE